MNSETIAVSSSRTKGIALVLIGATLWGVSGTVAQYLFQEQKFSAEWLVVIRLLLSGLILLVLAYAKGKQNIWTIRKDKQDRLSLVLFGIIGLLGVQYTYFAAIKNANAATATLLQYLGPVLITCYLAMRSRRFPSFQESVAVVLAFLGTFLLVTNGSIHNLSISKLALFWGISSAVALAYYTLQPHRLLNKWGSILIVGWGMFIGGIGFSFIRQPWNFEGRWSIASAFALVFVVLFGTLIAFYCYLESLKHISASETSLLACVEPLSAAFLSVVWLHVTFGFAEWIGTLCIISTIIILSLVKKAK
jgi:drug/metabolite transporter (DMT)-like permease